jgi:hypothetical protein
MRSLKRATRIVELYVAGFEVIGEVRKGRLMTG